MTPYEEPNEDEWTPDERAMLASLPKERIPPSELKARVISTLELRARERSPRRMLVLLLAASLIFVAGTLVGYTVASRAARRTAFEMATRRDTTSQAAYGKSDNQPTRQIIWY